MQSPTPSRPRPWKQVIGACVALALLAWLLSMAMRHTPPTVKRTPPRITQVILPPPPPPPPPPPEQKPEPKEETLVEAKPFEQLDPPPEATPDPPGDPLTADAGPGANTFGLQAGNGGGTRIGGKGGGGSPFAAYAGLVQRAVQQFLQRDEKTRKGRYSATVAVWLAADGTIQRSQVLMSAGKPELDAAIERALQGQTLPQPPPADLPQPINLRIGAIAPG